MDTPTIQWSEAHHFSRDLAQFFPPDREIASNADLRRAEEEFAARKPVVFINVWNCTAFIAAFKPSADGSTSYMYLVEGAPFSQETLVGMVNAQGMINMSGYYTLQDQAAEASP
jgi:hypothetical protein